jgi:hypothetical protein
MIRDDLDVRTRNAADIAGEDGNLPQIRQANASQTQPGLHAALGFHATIDDTRTGSDSPNFDPELGRIVDHLFSNAQSTFVQ